MFAVVIIISKIQTEGVKSALGVVNRRTQFYVIANSKKM